MKFTVIESKWIRGNFDPQGPYMGSRLVARRTGSMCCMGFLAKACGVPQDARDAAHYFSSVYIKPYDDLLPEALRPRASDLDDRAHGALAEEIYCVNDDTRISDDERKRKLTALFAQAGVEVEFQP